MKTHDYEKYAGEYAQLGIEGTYYLAFRDVPEILRTYVKGRKALDYGCGPGRSTRYLKSLGFEAVGVDISADMLAQARHNDEGGQYIQIQSGHLPFPDSSFDLIFSSFVFLEVATLDEIERILSEMKRVLKRNGFILFITSPTNCHKGKWVSFSYDFPENHREVHSGETIKLLILGTGVVLYDYYWTEEDYAKVADRVGLRIREIRKPLGRDDEPYTWLDEKHTGAMHIYVLDKGAVIRGGRRPQEQRRAESAPVPALAGRQQSASSAARRAT